MRQPVAGLRVHDCDTDELVDAARETGGGACKEPPPTAGQASARAASLTRQHVGVCVCGVLCAVCVSL